MPVDFKSLLESSRELTSHLVPPSFPQLEKGLDQIEQQTRKLAAKTRSEKRGILSTGPSGGLTSSVGVGAVTSTDSTRAHYLLANRGLDPEQIQETLNSISIAASAEPTIGLEDTDIDGYLAHERDSVIVTALDEEKVQIQKEYEEAYERMLFSDWEKTKKRIFEELGQHQTTMRMDDSMDTSLAGASGFDGSFSLYGANRSVMSTPGTGRFGSSLMFSPQPSPRAGAAAAAGTPAGARTTGWSGTDSQDRLGLYSELVANLNEARLNNTEFPVTTEFYKLSQKFDSAQATNQQLQEAWKLLNNILRKPRKQHQYLSLYNKLESEPESADAITFRKMVVNGAREFYEESFWKHIESQIASAPRIAAVGGRPTVHDKIRAFLTIRCVRSKMTTAQYVEGLEACHGLYNDDWRDGYPVWAHLYYLIRAGKVSEAVDYADNLASQGSIRETSFPVWLKLWKDSAEKRITDSRCRNEILQLWNQQFSRFSGASGAAIAVSGQPFDPYKAALIKILGRCDLQKKKLPERGIHRPSGTSEDYVWTQTVLVFEDHHAEDFEIYTLRDMSNTLLSVGPQHYAKTGNVLLYFFMCLVSGEFEKGILYLYERGSQFALEALHFAIALSFVGCLRVPESPYGFELGYRKATKTPRGDAYELTKLHFAMMIQQFAKTTCRADPLVALQYVYLLGLFGGKISDVPMTPMLAGKARSDTKKETTREYLRFSHEAIVQLILDTREYDLLIGSVGPSGVLQEGKILKYVPLVHIESTDEFRVKIIKRAAETAEKTSPSIMDVLKLFNLAEEYDQVLVLLNRRLVQEFDRKSGVAGVSGAGVLGQGLASRRAMDDTTNIDVIVEHAEQVMSFYKQSPTMSSRIKEENLRACELLCKLVEFMRLFEAGKISAAHAEIKRLDLLPLDSDAYATNVKVEELRKMDESIAKILPDILVTTMTCIYKLYKQLQESQYSDQTRVTRMADLRAEAQRLMSFAGCIHWRLPAEAFAQMNKLFVFMS